MQIANDAQIRDVEKWLICVLVHDDDVLCGLHSGQMLDGTRNAQTDIQFRAHGHARLPDLVCRGVHAVINSIAGGSNRRTKAICQGLDDLTEFLR